MEENYILAKVLSLQKVSEEDKLYPIFVLAIYGVLTVFKNYKNIVESVVKNTDVFIGNKTIAALMRENNYNPENYWGCDLGDLDEEEINLYAISYDGNKYVFHDYKEFIYIKSKPFIFCSTLCSDETDILMSVIHELAHLVKAEIKCGLLISDKDYFGYILRSGINLLEYRYYPNIHKAITKDHYVILDEVINCSQTEDAGKAILALKENILDERVNIFFNKLSKEKLKKDRGYQEALTAFKSLWENQIFNNLISDNIVEGNIEFIIEKFNAFTYEGCLERFDYLLYKVDELDYVGNNSEELYRIKQEVQQIIDLFYKNTKELEENKLIKKLEK